MMTQWLELLGADIAFPAHVIDVEHTEHEATDAPGEQLKAHDQTQPAMNQVCGLAWFHWRLFGVCSDREEQHGAQKLV
jgi:hypothetical protein